MVKDMDNELQKQKSENVLALVKEFIEQTGLGDAKMTLNSKTGTVSIIGSKGGYQYTTVMQQEKQGKLVKNTTFAVNVGKEALVEQIKDLRGEGYKQSEIADMLGVSQALVSKYLRL